MEVISFWMDLVKLNYHPPSQYQTKQGIVNATFLSTKHYILSNFPKKEILSNKKPSHPSIVLKNVGLVYIDVFPPHRSLIYSK